jgi:hypothetical protein
MYNVIRITVGLCCLGLLFWFGSCMMVDFPRFTETGVKCKEAGGYRVKSVDNESGGYICVKDILKK